MELSQKILQYMQDKGVTAYKISKATGISESLFSMWKKKPTSKVSVKNLELIAEYFGITVDELMGKDEPVPEIQMDGAFRAGKSRFTHSLGTMNLAGEIAERTKFIEMYEQIAEKKTAEADLQELQRFMEYLVKRGE